MNQTTPENLQRDIGSYTVDPATRYPNLNRTSVNVWQVKHLIDSDDPAILEQTFMDTNALQPTQVDTPVRRKRRSGGKYCNVKLENLFVRVRLLRRSPKYNKFKENNIGDIFYLNTFVVSMM